MSRHARLSLAPPHRLTQDTAAALSPRIKTGSPSTTGKSPTNSSITQAVSTIPSSSRRLIVIVQDSRRATLSFSSFVNYVGKSYRQYTFLSTQYPPTASKLASDK